MPVLWFDTPKSCLADRWGQMQTQDDAYLSTNGTQQAAEASWLDRTIELTHCIRGQV